MSWKRNVWCEGTVQRDACWKRCVVRGERDLQHDPCLLRGGGMSCVRRGENLLEGVSGIRIRDIN